MTDTVFIESVRGLVKLHGMCEPGSCTLRDELVELVEEFMGENGLYYRGTND